MSGQHRETRARGELPEANPGAPITDGYDYESCMSKVWRQSLCMITVTAQRDHQALSKP
jgi:hypothetical protein